MDNPTKKSKVVSSGLKFVILLGFVSLFGDMTYEGARSINGQYLSILGASAAVVGITSGLGELLGYSTRLFSGFLSDKSGKYWVTTIFGGYFLNLLAVPLLALAGNWQVAVLLMILERVGKGIRVPPRDAMLSHATKETGRGWGFGLHEAMDQIGAILGPSFIALVLYLKKGYKSGYAMLLIPAVLSLTVLLLAKARFPKPRELEIRTTKIERKPLPHLFWIYLISVSFIALGFADFPLIAYHFEKAKIIPQDLIPIFYAVAMGVDAVAALVCGKLFDKIGFTTLIIVSLISSLFAPFVFFGGPVFAIIGVSIWGIGMGAQESVMRAAIAEMAAADRRSTAYGIFNTGYGVAWFLGSTLIGVLYGISIPALVIFSVLSQLISVPLLFMVRKMALSHSKSI